MNKTEIMNKFNRTLNKATFQLKKHSPEILVVTGIVTGVAGAIMACKATTKVSTILEENRKTIDDINMVMENEDLKEKYTEEDAKQDIVITHVQTGLKLAKLYAPSIVLGVTSITCILASHNILHKRNVALAAAYNTIDRSFKDYRSRVIEKFGEELDRELKYNVKTQEIEEIVVDENGKEEVIKKTVSTVDSSLCSPYAKFFDCGNDNWEDNPEYNLLFLRAREKYANDLLKTRGRLFLNDVYDMLGIPRTKAGQMVGWVYDPSNEDIDCYVSFGIYDYYKDKNRDFVNGYEPTILLDFNVDGNVWELM